MIPRQLIDTACSMRRCAGVVAMGIALAVSACQDKSGDTPEATASAVAQGDGPAEASGPDARPGITAAEGRLVLPVVADRPAVAYFTLRNAASEPASLVAIHIDGVSKAEMHRTEGGKMSRVEALEVKPGQSVAFEPGGLHVMAFEPGPGLARVKSAEMTVTFSDGDKVSIPLSVERMGMDMDEGMDHGEMQGMKH